MSHFSYDMMRHFADSWGLLGMMIFFVAVVGFVFRPGSRGQYADAAQIPFRQEAED